MGKYKLVTYNSNVGKHDEFEMSLLREGGHDDFYHVHVDGNDDERFLKEAEDADAVCAWLDMDLQRYMRLKKCKVIVAPAIGADKFNLADATECGICIANVPDYCMEEVALHTVALVLDCARRLTMFDRTIKAGDWDDSICGKVYRMSGKTYGIVAFGRIPQKVAAMMKGFGVNVVGYDPFAKDEVFESAGVKRIDDLNELFKLSDYISIHTPYMKATHHMIGKEQFDCMKGDGIIVVTGRGGVVDENALLDAINEGKVASAGLDVIEDETNHESVLKDLSNVIMTPHCGYYSEDARFDLRRKVIEQIIDVVRNHRPPKNLMNKDVLESKALRQSF